MREKPPMINAGQIGEIVGSCKQWWEIPALVVQAQRDADVAWISEEIEKGLLTDEERMKVYIPCETCSFTRDVLCVRCLDCFVKCHAQAQLQKILALLK